jgi:uncharacterized protein (DUF302 family)
MSFGIRKVVSLSYDEVLARAPEALQSEGFGVLTEIDVKATMKDKLGIDYRPYKILGACSAPLAQRALAAEPHVGVLMPCSVVVWDEGDHRVVAAMEPRLMSGVVDSSELRAVADEVSVRLHRVLELLG